MRDRRPMLELSPQAFNARTGLLIGLPTTTAAFSATNPFALAVGAGTGRKASKTSYVLCHQPRFFDWRAHKANPHPSIRLADPAFAQACKVLKQIVALG